VQQLRIDARDIHQLVGVEDAEAPVAECEDAVRLEIAQHPVDVDPGQARRVSDILLRQRQMHLLDPVAGPLQPIADEQLEDEVSNALARRVPPDAGQMSERQAAVPRHQPGEPQADLRILSRQGSESLVRNDADHRIGQGLGAIGHHRAVRRMKAEYGAWQCEVQDLPTPVFEQVVEDHPAVNEIVDRVAWFAEAQEFLAGPYESVSRLVPGEHAQVGRGVALAKPVDASLASCAVDLDSC
jgi:hypothetical protein